MAPPPPPPPPATDRGERLRATGANVRERRFEVDQNFEGWRLDQYLADRIPRLSRAKAGQIARHGDVRLQPPRGRLKASTRLQQGDVLIVREQLGEEQTQYDEVRVLHRDAGLLILDKPAGMLVHESSTTRLNTITMYLREALGEAQAEPVHRIDRETSGALVCARRQELVPVLRGQFADEASGPQKVYRALALDPSGQWPTGAHRTLAYPLGFDPASTLPIKMGPGRLPATTHVRCLGRRDLPLGFGPAADLEVRIETGRQHQIRVHLALENTPIAGDKLYSLDDNFFRAISDDPKDLNLQAQLPFTRQALHAWRLRLLHPDTGQALAIEAPLPGEVWGEGQGDTPSPR